MIKDALEWLASQTVQATTAQDLAIDDPRAKRVLINGNLLSIPLPTAPRNHAVKSLADFIAAVKAFSDGPAVFFDESGCYGILDLDEHRVECVRFALVKSDQFNTLLSLSIRSWMDQKAFVRLLRVDLADTMAPAVLLDLVRSIKLENGSMIRSEVGRQKESIGRSITSQVSTERDLPEEVQLSLPLYKSLGEKEPYVVSCSVEVDPTRTEAFRLLPLPDEIERVQHLAMASIRDRLVDAMVDVPVFYGCP